MGQIPKGESCKIQAGYAFDIIGKRKVLNYDTQRRSEEAVIEIVIKKIDIGLYAMNAFPKKTNKSVGIGKKNISIRFGNTEINNGDWIYFDTNGWVISKAKLIF